MLLPFMRRPFPGVLAAVAALSLSVPLARASVEAPAIVKDVFAGPSSSITELGPPGLAPASLRAGGGGRHVLLPGRRRDARDRAVAQRRDRGRHLPA